MKKTTYTLLTTVVMLALLSTANTRAAVILDVTGPNTGASLAFGDDDINNGLEWGAFAVSFEFDQPFTDVSISAPITCPAFSPGDPTDPFNNDQAACSGELILLQSDGLEDPNPTIVAVREYSGNDFAQDGSATTLLDNLNLSAGIYQLVMSVESTFAVWGAADPVIQAAAGVTHLASWFSSDILAGAPWIAEDPWSRVEDQINGGFAEYYYTIEASIPGAPPVDVPEPGTIGPLLIGLLCLQGLHRRQHS